MFDKKVIQKICQSCGCRYEEPLHAYHESDVDLSHGICNACLETKYCRRCGDEIEPPEGMDEGIACLTKGLYIFPPRGAFVITPSIACHFQSIPVFLSYTDKLSIHIRLNTPADLHSLTISIQAISIRLPMC
jgi:hypothetical protein